MSYEQTRIEVIEWRPGQGDFVIIDEFEKALDLMPQLREENEQIQTRI